MTRGFVALAVAMFCLQFANGVNRSIQNNFFVETLGLEADQMGFLTTAREVPGFLTAMIIGLGMRLAPPDFGAISLAVMGVGYGSYGLVQDFAGLAAVGIVGSLGFHTWMPISNALGLSLANRDNPGEVLGRLQTVGFVGALVSMGLVALVVGLVGYRVSFFASGAIMAVGALAILFFPRTIAERPKERMVFRRKYSLYYALTFLDGCRGEVFMAFGVYLLVRQYLVDVRTITLLLMASSIISMLLSQPVGRLIDRIGERRTLTFSYSCHFLTFLGFALVHDGRVAIGLYVIYNVLMLFSMGTNTYLKRTADPGDVAPSLAMGMTTMHVSAMIVPILGGMLWERFGFELPFILGACFIALSILVCQRIPAHRPRPAAEAA